MTEYINDDLGNLPTFPSNAGKNTHGQEGMMGVILVSHRPMERITAEMRIRSALKDKFPPPTKYDLKPGMQVPIYREKIRRYEVLFTIVKIYPKEV